MAPQEFANQVVQGGNLPALVADIRRNKTLAEVLEAASVPAASGNAVDLKALSAHSPASVAKVDEEADDDS